MTTKNGKGSGMQMCVLGTVWLPDKSILTIGQKGYS